MAKCDKCGNDKPDNELTLMMEGAGIRRFRNSRIVEVKVREWVEGYSGKKIVGFPYVCLECQRDEMFKAIMRAKY